MAKKGDTNMKRTLFVFICLLSLVAFVGCGQEQYNTPEEVLTKLFSGKLKSSDEVRKLLYLEEDTDGEKKFTILKDEIYDALGYKNRANYEKKFISKILNIDHVENLKIEKMDLPDMHDYYKINGTIHYKDGSIETLDNGMLPVKLNKNEKNGKAKYLLKAVPFFKLIGDTPYSFTTYEDNKKIWVELYSFYGGDTICFIGIIGNHSDNEFILSDWPNGANVIWGDKSEMLQKPLTIKSANNPIGQESSSGAKYHATFVSVFNLGKIVTVKDAEKLIQENDRLIINYITKVENGLPSMRHQKQPLSLEYIGGYDWSDNF